MLDRRTGSRAPGVGQSLQEYRARQAREHIERTAGKARRAFWAMKAEAN